ncbi:MAG: hypothetical protein ACM3SY_05580 [Candidatus Omnitrophota bacterium]
MNSTNKRVDELLERARSGFENAKNNENIKMMISPYGYEENRLQGLLDLRSETNGRYLERKQKYAMRLQTSSLYAAKLKEERTRYVDYKKFALMAFSDTSDRQYFETLGLGGGKTKQRLGFVSQAKHFYQNALGQQKILDKLAYFLITPEKLQEGLAGIEELERLQAAKVAVSGEVQIATLERNNACQKLQKAYANFIETSKIGLRNVPQLREILGIRDSNTPTRKRTAEGQENQSVASDESGELETSAQKIQNNSTVLKMVKDSSVTAPTPKTKEPEKDIEMTESGE